MEPHHTLEKFIIITPAIGRLEGMGGFRNGNVGAPAGACGKEIEIEFRKQPQIAQIGP